MINRYKSHLLVLFEDQAYLDIYNGFRLNASIIMGVMQGKKLSKGWHKVVAAFSSEYISYMEENPHSHLLMLIDFDNDPARAANIQENEVPPHLQSRVFILGSLKEAENLRADFGRNFEKLGKQLAKDCVDGTSDAWGHRFLQHNANELQRMINSVKPFLFRT